MISLRNLLFFALVARSFSELVKWKPCYYSGESGKHCTIKDLHVDPCSEAATDQPCRVKRGDKGTIFFKYTLDFEPEGPLKTHAYWMAPYADVPWADMDTDVCKISKCPVVKNVENTYNYSLNIASSYPAQKLSVKWRIWEENKGRDRECCLIFKLVLV